MRRPRRVIAISYEGWSSRRGHAGRAPGYIEATRDVLPLLPMRFPQGLRKSQQESRSGSRALRIAFASRSILRKTNYPT